MVKEPHKVTLKVEPGYALSHIGENEWKVLKLDLTATPAVIVKRYHIKGGQCECKGFAHRGECRHVDMARGVCASVDKKTARREATEVMNEWADLFRRIVIDHYVYDKVNSDAEGNPLVHHVKLEAHGSPLVLDGIEHRRILGVRKKALVIVEIVA
jgi:hypothetical protein